MTTRTPTAIHPRVIGSAVPATESGIAAFPGGDAHQFSMKPAPTVLYIGNF